MSDKSVDFAISIYLKDQNILLIWCLGVCLSNGKIRSHSSSILASIFFDLHVFFSFSLFVFFLIHNGRGIYCASFNMYTIRKTMFTVLKWLLQSIRCKFWITFCPHISVSFPLEINIIPTNSVCIFFLFFFHLSDFLSFWNTEFDIPVVITRL